MIVDTDVLVWYMRGNAHARRVLEGLDAFSISAVTYMEILQGVRDNAELRALKRFMVSRRIACARAESSSAAGSTPAVVGRTGSDRAA